MPQAPAAWRGSPFPAWGLAMYQALFDLPKVCGVIMRRRTTPPGGRALGASVLRVLSSRAEYQSSTASTAAPCPSKLRPR